MAVFLPVIGYPLAELVEKNGGPTDIAMFQRMFFTVPVLLSTFLLVDRLNEKRKRCRARPLRPIVFLSVFAIAATGIVLEPSRAPYFNRFWHVVSMTPNDLTLQPLLREAELSGIASPTGLVVAPPVATAVAYSNNVTPYGSSAYRLIGKSQVNEMADAVSFCGALISNFLPANPVRASSVKNEWASPYETGVPEPKYYGWMLVGGNPPETPTPSREIEGALFPIHNPAGRASYILSSELNPVSGSKTYVVSITISQAGNANAGNYLCIAWYDENKRLLEANKERPLGAGNPDGWVNGTYSYFGLTNTPAPLRAKTFRCEFGAGTGQRIPAGASYARLGALLNYTDAPKLPTTIYDGERIPIQTPRFASSRRLRLPYTLQDLSPD
ncbi:MAG: hypothetical protein IPP19_03900 [Verrucomicrobia bacterium]|nr:hypothetical protein [Verrucomicrobiota bacterium]